MIRCQTPDATNTKKKICWVELVILGPRYLNFACRWWQVVDVLVVEGRSSSWVLVGLDRVDRRRVVCSEIQSTRGLQDREIWALRRRHCVGNW